MNPTIYRLSLDVCTVDSQGMLPVKAGDTARAISFTLRQKGEPYPVPQGVQAILTARKADGNILMDPCEVREDGIYYPFTSQLTPVEGEVLCELRLYGGEGQLLTCPRFSILVAGRVVDDGEIVESSAEFTALKELVEETMTIRDLWQELLDNGMETPQLSPALREFESALQTYEPREKAGLPVSDPQGGYRPMEILGAPTGTEGVYVIPTVTEVETLVRTYGDFGSRGLDFDGGYVDEAGFLHLTLGGIEVEEFGPVYIGTAMESPDDLLLEGDRLYLTKDGEPMGEGVTLPAGGGTGGNGSVMKLMSLTQSSSFSVMDTAKEALILYAWSSVDGTDGTPTGKGSESWYVGDKRVFTRNTDQGEGSFNIMPYLEHGTENVVKLTVEDAYGTTRSRVWTVTVISFGLSWDLEQMSVHPCRTMAVRLIPTGMGEKTLRLFLDGREHYVTTVSSSGKTLSVDLPALSHGVHRVRATLEITAEGQTIETEPLTHVGIWYEEGNVKPVVAFYEEEYRVPCYGTASVSYLVYDPLTENANIILYDNEQEISLLTVGRAMEIWAYRPTEEGQRVLSIAVAETQVRESMTLSVTPLGYDIAPVTAGLLMECSPAGHSNTEQDRLSFGYIDGEGENHPFLFSQGFDWENGGFRRDEEGVTALVIKRGSTVTLDRSFFEGDATASGREIKLILKATACRDYEAQFLTCYHAPVGLILKAQEGILSSESETLTFPYCEEDKLEIDLNIASSKEHSIASVWLDGIPSGIIAYASTDSWAQAVPQGVVIGSPDCDVWLYGIRMYGNGLTKEDILANFIADAGTTEEMIARFERNDIYSASGELSMTKLQNANPDLRILHISASDMTTSKSHEVTCKVELSHKKGMGFTATGVIMKAQGTSSLEYGLAALNLDLDFSGSKWENQAGETITAYAMEPTSVPVNYFNIKLNVASSENANNICLAREYNDRNPYRAQPRVDNNAGEGPFIRDTVEGHPCAVFLTNTASKAISVGARTLAPGETMLYGCGDMNNSKKNFAVFGQDNSQYPKQCCVEILNNNNDPCRFKSADLSGETWDGAEGTSNFEFRYPKEPTQEMKETFASLLAWVVSTDPQGATAQTLLRPVKYGEVTYNIDSADYRRAKFRYELSQWFSVDSLLFHYLFTEYHLMVDNRAKNTFLSYEWDKDAGGYRWNFNKDYDNDTAAGTDNSGGLTFRYGLEDTDSVGAQRVFNAWDSVLWCNIRDVMAPELKAMYRALESQKVWEGERILELFRTYQSATPEILASEDMWAKYVMPYVNKGEKRYLEMAQGKKTHQRSRFYRYQERYMSSKYEGSSALSDSLSLRISAVSDLTLTPYSDVYAHVKFGNASVVKLRTRRGETVTIPCRADTANDLETYIYSAGSVSRVGDLSGFMAKEIELNSAVKLRNLPLGSREPGYENADLKQLSFGTINNLETIDLTGLSKLSGNLDLTAFDGLKEFYASASGISGVIFATNAPLETAVLPMVGTLILRGLGKLKSLTFDPRNLINLRLEDCPGIDSLSLCAHATGLRRGRITDVSWDNCNTDLLLRLAGLAGYDEEGRAAERFVLTGRATVPTICADELDILHRAFPNLELTYGELVPAYTVTFLNHDGSVLHSKSVRQGGTCPDPVATGEIPMPTKDPTVGEVFTFAEWDLPLTDIQGDKTVRALFFSNIRKYTVRWFDGSRLLQTDIAEAHEAVTYKGPEPVSTEEDVIWIGWDKSDDDLASVTYDMDVYAMYMSPLEQVTPKSGHAYLYSDDPEDDSAYTLGEFYTILTKDLGKQYFRLGDKIKMKLNTTVVTDREIVLSLYGFNHYRLSGGDGAFAKAVFGMIGVMNLDRAMHDASTNEGGWRDCRMRNILNNTIFPNLPRHWQAMIKTVDVRGTLGYGSNEVGIAQDKLFLFSWAEVGKSASLPYLSEVDPQAENVTFPVFTDDQSRIKYAYNGEGDAKTYWTRSPIEGTSNSYWRVNKIGTAEGAAFCVATYVKDGCVSFGFCI